MTNKRSLIYISGPYRAKTPLKVLGNIKTAWSTALKLWKAGAAVICPHANTAGMGAELLGPESGITDKDLIEGDLVMIERCHAVLMLDHWTTSEGACIERKHARDIGVPVYHSLHILLSDLTDHTLGSLSFAKACGTNGSRNPAAKKASLITPAPTAPPSPDPENPKAAAGRSKTPFHLVPERATALEAEVMRTGAEKYGAYNWRVVPVKMSIYVSAIRRHLAAMFDGEDFDPTSKQLHVAHIRANTGILLDAWIAGMLIDDRPGVLPGTRTPPPPPTPGFPEHPDYPNLQSYKDFVSYSGCSSDCPPAIPANSTYPACETPEALAEKATNADN